MVGLAGEMSHDVILGANREWFPNLRDELLRHDKGEQTRTLTQLDKSLSDMRKSPPVTPDMESAPSLESASNAKSSDDILAPTDAADDKNGLLAPDKAGDTSPDSLLGNANRNDNAPPERFDPESWAESGGWYRQDFAIRYRPSGHANWFLKAWLDFAGHVYGATEEDRLAPIFESLASQDSIGRCTKCHSTDIDAGLKKVNWWPFDPARVKKDRFTTFAHKPHIDAVGSKGCAACHQLNPTGGKYLESYAQGDPARYASNFLYIEKTRCAACHIEKTAGENCTLCHYYHVNEIADELGAPRR
jgi:hypothetical protein